MIYASIILMMVTSRSRFLWLKLGTATDV